MNNNSNSCQWIFQTESRRKNISLVFFKIAEIITAITLCLPNETKIESFVRIYFVIQSICTQDFDRISNKFRANFERISTEFQSNFDQISKFQPFFPFIFHSTHSECINETVQKKLALWNGHPLRLPVGLFTFVLMHSLNCVNRSIHLKRLSCFDRVNVARFEVWLSFQLKKSIRRCCFVFSAFEIRWEYFPYRSWENTV